MVRATRARRNHTDREKKVGICRDLDGATNNAISYPGRIPEWSTQSGRRSQLWADDYGTPVWYGACVHAADQERERPTSNWRSWALGQRPPPPGPPPPAGHPRQPCATDGGMPRALGTHGDPRLEGAAIDRTHAPPTDDGRSESHAALEVVTKHVERLLEEHEKKKTNSPTGSATESVRFEKATIPDASTMMFSPGLAFSGPPPMGVSAVGVGGTPGLGVGMGLPGLGMMFAPQIALMWANDAKPSFFNDDSNDWDRFDREWQKWDKITRNSGYPIPDPVKLETLKSLVGEGSKQLLIQMEEEDPNQAFAKYYEALRATYARDQTEQARVAWQNVTLKIPKGGVMTLQAFCKYRMECGMKRGRVCNWTPTEEYGLIFRELPRTWAIRVREEEHKRNRTKCWVKVSNTPDMSAGALKAAFLGEEITVREVHTTDGGFLALAADESNRSALLALNGRAIMGKALKIVATQVKMKGEEIFAFIEERMRLVDEAVSLNQLKGGEGIPFFEPLESRINCVGEAEAEYGMALARQANAANIHGVTDLQSERHQDPPAVPQPSDKDGGQDRRGRAKAGPDRAEGWAGKGKSSSYGPPSGATDKGAAAKGKGKGDAEKGGDKCGKGQRRSPRSRESLGAPPATEPNPGTWDDGWGDNSCWGCQKLGLDYHHDWKACKHKRTADRIGKRRASD